MLCSHFALFQKYRCGTTSRKRRCALMCAGVHKCPFHRINFHFLCALAVLTMRGREPNCE